MTKLSHILIFAISIFIFGGCLEKEEEELNYTSISEFYGTWEMTLEQSGNAPGASDGFKEYVKFSPNGRLSYLKVYNSSYYPDGMKDLKEFKWALEGNNLQFDVMTYHVDYCSGNEIFISRENLIYKLRKISETLWEYYTQPENFKDYQSVDQDGVILNYKSIEDFYGTWKLNSSGSANSETTEYVKITEDGKLLTTTVNETTGVSETRESTWSIKQNTFYWGILNYEIDYCKAVEISLSRSSTHLVLTRVAE